MKTKKPIYAWALVPKKGGKPAWVWLKKPYLDKGKKSIVGWDVYLTEGSTGDWYTKEYWSLTRVRIVPVKGKRV